MKKNKIISFLIVGIISTMLIGCSKREEEVVAVVETEEENMFGLTESEQKMYAEYAAGALMKYNAGTDMRVLEGQTLVNQEAKEKAAREQAERREQLAAEYEANKKNKKEENGSEGGSLSSSGESSISYISDMAAAAGTDAFSITYTGYEVTDSYPDSGEDMFMAMEARNGKVFLVAKFAVTNVSGQTENFNMFSKKGTFRLKVNGEHFKSQYTLLLDDLSMYKGDIAAGETIDTVLIFEIPKASASNVNDMVLSITMDDKTSSMQLVGGTGVINDDINLEDSEDITIEEADGLQEENMDNEEMSPEASDENSDSDEYNDLAEEYMNALEAENAGVSYDDNSSMSDDVNVTVVGSKRN